MPIVNNSKESNKIDLRGGGSRSVPPLLLFLFNSLLLTFSSHSDFLFYL